MKHFVLFAIALLSIPSFCIASFSEGVFIGMINSEFNSDNNVPMNIFCSAEGTLTRFPSIEGSCSAKEYQLAIVDKLALWEIVIALTFYGIAFVGFISKCINGSYEDNSDMAVTITGIFVGSTIHSMLDDDD
jgi:hypothetical protein